jgi:hypothetical protein
MAIVQSGPPEWIWERTPDPLKWEVKELPASDGPHSVYELRLLCGLKILRLQVFNQQEMWGLVDTLSHVLQRRNRDGRQGAY